jgi:hypothetical protein
MQIRVNGALDMIGLNTATNYNSYGIPVEEQTLMFYMRPPELGSIKVDAECWGLLVRLALSTLLS